MNANLDWLGDQYGGYLLEEMNVFVNRARREREALLRFNDRNNKCITADILVDIDNLVRQCRLSPRDATIHAIHFNYFKWIENVLRQSITQYDRTVPEKYIDEVYLLMGEQPPLPPQPMHHRNTQNVRSYQQPQPVMGGQYQVQNVRRMAPQQANSGHIQMPISHTHMPCQPSVVNQPASSPIQEVTEKLVRLTNRTVTFSMKTIDKEGKEVNINDHAKFHEDVLAAKNKDYVDVAAPIVTVGEANSEDAELDRLGNSLLRPKSLQLVEVIMTPPEDEDDKVMSCPKSWFTSVDREVLSILSTTGGSYLYTGVAHLESAVRVLTPKALNKIVTALRGAELTNIDTLLTGVVEANAVHPIDVAYLREEIITSLNNVLGTVLGLTPTSYFHDLSALTPTSSSGNILQLIVDSIKEQSTSPIIKYLDIAAELNNAVTRVLGDIRVVDDSDILLLRKVGVGYISRNLEELRFGSSILETGYVTTTMDSLQEIADTVQQAIRDYGEYHLLTSDGYTLVLSTSVVPTSRNPGPDPSGGLLFARIDGVNAVNKRLSALLADIKS